MLVKIIATYTGRGSYNGFNFTPDDGRPLNPGEVRFTCYKNKAKIIELLKQVKADYRADMRQLEKDQRERGVALEYTYSMREAKKAIEKQKAEARLIRGLGI